MFLFRGKNLPIIFFCFFSFLALGKNNSLFQGQKGFIQNKGQILDQNFQPNNDVLFLFSGNGIKVQLRKNGYSYEVFSANNFPGKPNANIHGAPVEDLHKTKLISHRVDINFASLSENCSVEASEQLPAEYNYFISGSKTNAIKAFKKVIYKNVYPNTDIEFIITENKEAPLKYNIILHPGADLKKVQFMVEGADNVKRDAEGRIEFNTTLGKLTERIPESYYFSNPQNKVIVQQELSSNRVSFSASYNSSETLVIDPSTNIIWGTYFGGASLDNCTSIGSDAAGNIYMAGHTLSTSNIATSGVYQSTLSGSYDVYLAKFTSSGNLTWCSYFGGPNLETAYAIYVEANGNVYVCGDTSSPTGVASTGAHQTTYGGGIDDATLIKFDTNGQLLWATYYGGNQHDIAYALTVDSSGNPIISGHTESPNTSNCIATAGAYSTAFVLSSDAFIAKFNSNGVRQWGTYYGDTGFEETWGVKCDASSNIIITGFSTSLSGLSTPPCHQNFNAGAQDAFIAKFNSSGTTLIWGTYFGGSGDEQGTAVEIDNTGTIFISGNTTSPTGVATPGSYQTTIASSDDGFITTFNTSGTQLWGTYFGGGDTDYINCMKLDNDMNLLFCGQTLSSNGIAVASAYQPSIAAINNYDAYFAKFSNNGNLKLGTYYGGEANDNAKGLVVATNGIVYLCGETTSTMGISTPGSYMPVYGTTGDGFLARFCVAPEPFINPAGNATICMNVNYTLTTQPGYSSYFWNTGANTNSLVLVQPITPGVYYYTVTLNDIYGCNGTSDSTTITVNNCTTDLPDANKNLMELNVYPNPAEDLLFIEMPEGLDFEQGRLEIYATNGAVVYKQSFNKKHLFINTSSYAEGVYLVRISDGKQTFSRKMVHR